MVDVRCGALAVYAVVRRGVFLFIIKGIAGWGYLSHSRLKNGRCVRVGSC